MRNPYTLSFIALFIVAAMGCFFFAQISTDLQQELTIKSKQLESFTVQAQVNYTEVKQVDQLEDQLSEVLAQVEQLQKDKSQLELDLELLISEELFSMQQDNEQIIITLSDKVLFTSAGAHITDEGKGILKEVGSSLHEYKK